MILLARSWRALVGAAALALAACQVAPPVPTPSVAPPVPPTPAPAVAQIVYTAVPFDALPGWSADAQDEAWPALLAGCRALEAGATRDLWSAACRDAAALPAPDRASARA